jgi:hypothetical protein
VVSSRWVRGLTDDLDREHPKGRDQDLCERVGTRGFTHLAFVDYGRLKGIENNDDPETTYNVA